MVESTFVLSYHSQIVIANERIQDVFFVQHDLYLFSIFVICCIFSLNDLLCLSNEIWLIRF